MYIHIIRCYSIYIESENHSFLMYRMKISIIVIVIVHCITFEKMESLSKACFGAFKKSRGRLLCLSVYVKPTFAYRAIPPCPLNVTHAIIRALVTPLGFLPYFYGRHSNKTEAAKRHFETINLKLLLAFNVIYINYVFILIILCIVKSR